MSRYTVRSTEHLTPSILKLTLALENPNQKPLAFLPGQYASISFKHKGRPSSYRCFSIASSPTTAVLPTPELAVIKTYKQTPYPN